jgi:hypothetical protein
VNLKQVNKNHPLFARPSRFSPEREGEVMEERICHEKCSVWCKSTRLPTKRLKSPCPHASTVTYSLAMSRRWEDRGQCCSLVLQLVLAQIPGCLTQSWSFQPYRHQKTTDAGDQPSLYSLPSQGLHGYARVSVAAPTTLSFAVGDDVPHCMAYCFTRLMICSHGECNMSRPGSWAIPAAFIH